MTVNNALHILNPFSRQIRLQKKRERCLSQNGLILIDIVLKTYTDLKVTSVKVTNFTM